ncbi:MAG: glycerate kinase [Desulfobacterales bacterium]
MKNRAGSIFNAALSAVEPKSCVNRHLQVADGVLRVSKASFSLEKTKKLYLVGAGKASAAMAAEVEKVLADRIDVGLVITKYGHGLPLRQCRVMEAGHPVPDENGVEAARALLDLIATAGPEDLILCMISGGGSALTPAPAKGISLAEKQEATRLLLACGATIHEINTVRKHLSRIKGGLLCRRANGARIVSLILSDVIGDNLDIIASGLTAPDPSSFGDCIGILSRYGLLERVSESVRDHLVAGDRGDEDETPKPGDFLFASVENRIIGSVTDALSAAEGEARRLGFNPLILSSMIQGEAREVAKVLAAIAGEVRRSDRPIPAPACLLSGGETTVTLKGEGKGGRNMELALAAGIALSGVPDTLILSAGTDGSDGPTDAAGGFADGSTVIRAEAVGLSASAHLAENDSYPFFQRLGDLFITGPTRTNVMDLQILLIDT